MFLLRGRRTDLLAACAALLVIGATTAFAQDYEHVAPKEPAPPTQPGKIITGPAQDAQTPAASPDDAKIVLQTLRGLRFLPRAADVIKTGSEYDGLDVATVPGLDDPALVSQLRPYLGRPLTFGGLHAITRTVIAFLRSEGRNLVDVAIPEQDISSGTVQIVVTEFVFGKLKVKGNRRFSREIFEDGIEARPGQPIDLDQLKHDLDWLNRNPFRKVDVVLARGETAGTTDIQLDVQEEFPLRAYAAFSNAGLPATGRDQWSVGTNFGNLFGLDQQLSYQFTAGDDFLRHATDGRARFMAHSASYTAPLPWHDTISVFGSYSRQSPNVGADFGQIGVSATLSGRYTSNFEGPSWLTHDVQWGFDYKTTNNNLAFGGVQVFAASQDVDQWVLIYDATAVDSWGVTTLENDAYYSPGGLTPDNTNHSFAESGTSFVKANYGYDTLSLTRATQLPFNTSWLSRIKGQVASGDLLPSEQLGGGGEGSVRGYNPRAANGSEGVLVSEELRSPPVSLLDWAFGAGTGDNAQVLGFWDYARLNDPHAQPKNPPHFSLASAGPGFNYAIGRALDLRADYGWELLKLPGATKHRAEADISLTLSY